MRTTIEIDDQLLSMFDPFESLFGLRVVHP